jgi:NAD(P)-dependent dehydrogenase (short-subunit alcohol dehydrogenase family)
MAHGLTMRLKGEIAFVTGAGRGIGAETARVLARHGAAVAVTARKRVYADTIAAELTAAGGRALALSCDVTDAGSIEAAIAVATQELGAPTILVNNAGVILPLGPLHETSAAEWAANVTANLVGAANAARAVLPAMLAAGRGAIVNLSSGAAHIPIAGWGAYCAAKAGLAMLTKTLAAEYGEKGIRIFGFAPGLVDTAMQEAIRAAGIGPVAKLPREKLTSPREPAEAIAFLVSRAGDRFAGQELDIRNADFRAAAGLAPLAA